MMLLHCSDVITFMLRALQMFTIVHTLYAINIQIKYTTISTAQRRRSGTGGNAQFLIFSRNCM